MKRVLTRDLRSHIDSEVIVSGVVKVVRNQSKVAFLDVEDRSGLIQCVVFGKPAIKTQCEEIKEETSVKITGIVKKREDGQLNSKVENGDLEMEITSVLILNPSIPLPFELNGEIGLETNLDNRPLTLRRNRERAIFKVQSQILKSYREFLVSNDFIEFQAPKVVGGDAEGGAEVFKVDYFREHSAALATSPQLYKQIMVGVFERVFAVGQTFRAEKSATSRHLSEISMLDLEMGFIEDHKDVIRLVSDLILFMSKNVEQNCSRELGILEAEAPLTPNEIPVMTLKEVQELIKKETGEDKTSEPDLEPEDERFICEYAHKNLQSDWIFVTHFPVSKRPFYTATDPENTDLTLSFDLLFRGLEMCSGGMRVHDKQELQEKMEMKGLDPAKFSYYLQAFEYGVPPHGGIGMGLERLTMKFCGLENVREATLFPRDMNRIDTLLSKDIQNEANND
ncbi:aspartate--tRNA(Asn) ligase [bacterium]|nr:aspartate--tRNA(Asn) ligase [bacterium]